MEHIKCEVCGAALEPGEQCCPKCGWSRESDPSPEEGKVKGGRYSSENVKRRMAQTAAVPEEESDNRGLLIVIAILCVAIAMVSCYIALRFFWGRDAYTGTTSEPTETVQAEIPCAGIVLDTGVLHLETLGQQMQLGMKLLPGNTTDPVTYASSDEAVVTVSETGMLTAAGSGQAEITITCGDQTKKCTIVCWLKEAPQETTQPTEPQETIPAETTKPTQPTAPKPTEPKPTEPVQTSKRLRLNQEDVSFYTKGETYQFTVKYGGKKLDPSLVTWTSSDEGIVSVKDGKITILARGTVTITASYEGKSDSCIVRSKFPKDEDTSGDSGSTDDSDNTSSASGWYAAKTDVTIVPGESFSLRVKNNQGQTARNVTWTMSQEGIVTVAPGDKSATITGLAKGEVTLTATVDGITVRCIVRVK